MGKREEEEKKTQGFFFPRPSPKNFLWILARIYDSSRAECLRRRMCDVGVSCLIPGVEKKRVTTMKIL